MKDSPIRLGITLLLIAGIMGLILGGAYTLTKDTIDEKKDAANKAALRAGASGCGYTEFRRASGR